MASILKVDTITGVTTAGSIAVTGEGNSTTTNLQQGLAKGWLNFDATGTVEARDSFNVSSMIDSATGQFGCNISNNMNNANPMAMYDANGSSDGYNLTSGETLGGDGPRAAIVFQAASQFKFHVYNDSYIDGNHNNVGIWGDLA